LGDNRINPEIGPFDQYNYYQFGRPNAVANASTMPESLPNFDLSMFKPATNVWNLGTESNPIKNHQKDPCPRGYRVPTATEYQSLIDGTIYSSVGTWTESVINYSSAGIFTSKKNSAVKLTIPAGGVRTAGSSGKLIWRGIGGYLFTSSVASVNTSNHPITVSIKNSSPKNGNLFQHNFATCIRCIAEN
jgi:uncharacterized protein (TIGR02145 family)